MTNHERDHHDQAPPALSEAGLARKRLMLETLAGEMRRVHRRRRARGRAAAILSIVLVGVGATVVARVAVPPVPIEEGLVKVPNESDPDRDVPAVAEPVPPVADVVIVATDPGILERYRGAVTSSAEILDDDGLLAVLARLDRPAGLVRMEGRAFLMER